MSDVRIPHPIEILYGSGVALACGLDGRLRAHERHGFFVADTRVLSTHTINVGGHPLTLLARHRSGHGTAEWKFQTPALRTARGDIPPAAAFVELRRRVQGALHEDVRLCAFESLRTRLVLHIDSDFADIFEVRESKLPPRPGIARVASGRTLRLEYARGGFQRALEVSFEAPSQPQFVGSLVVFDLDIQAGTEWVCCIDAVPEIDNKAIPFAGDPHEAERESHEPSSLSLAADPLLQRPFERGRADLHALSMPHEGGHRYVAAGVPWFLALFGRDSLTAAIMTGVSGDAAARGALAAVGRLQAAEHDDRRDAEPGKLPHELRRGELAHTGRILHTPYYGTHDTPSLYGLALWNTWRWTGDDSLLREHMPTALEALRWCDELGDRDGDGFQEYETRSPSGYYNQSWKDAGDAILQENGSIAETPLATVELQGYLYAARLAVAEMLEWGDRSEDAQALRRAAHQLRVRTEASFWVEDKGFYALALDGKKARIDTIASNPGHLLWTGLVSRKRAARVASRLLGPDMFSGWGLRTLSSAHLGYNALSYQRGSVWPHDTMLAAAGMFRYGLKEDGAKLVKAILDAAELFEDDRLPELFCGFDRSEGIPVPYVEANVPQAWAASAPILAVQIFLGIVPDVPHGRCFISPWLPDWLPMLRIRGLNVGKATLEITARRAGNKTVVESLEVRGQLDVVQEHPGAALWGAPLAEAAAGF